MVLACANKRPLTVIALIICRLARLTAVNCGIWKLSVIRIWLCSVVLRVSVSCCIVLFLGTRLRRGTILAGAGVGAEGEAFVAEGDAAGYPCCDHFLIMLFLTAWRVYDS